MSVVAAQLTLSDFFPGAFGMLLSAAHAGGQVLQAVHVQSTTPIARWQYALAFCQGLHSVDHLSFEGSSVVLLLWNTVALASSGKETGWRVRDWDW
jgi:hypothetical protein